MTEVFFKEKNDVPYINWSKYIFDSYAVNSQLTTTKICVRLFLITFTTLFWLINIVYSHLKNTFSAIMKQHIFRKIWSKYKKVLNAFESYHDLYQFLCCV